VRVLQVQCRLPHGHMAWHSYLVRRNDHDQLGERPPPPLALSTNSSTHQPSTINCHLLFTITIVVIIISLLYIYLIDD
jgi:hypothetical protein